MRSLRDDGIYTNGDDEALGESTEGEVQPLDADDPLLLDEDEELVSEDPIDTGEEEESY